MFKCLSINVDVHVVTSKCVYTCICFWKWDFIYSNMIGLIIAYTITYMHV